MSADTRQVGKAVNEYVQRHAQPTYDDVVAHVTQEVPESKGEVIDALEALIENGFVYPVDVDGETVVKVA